MVYKYLYMVYTYIYMVYTYIYMVYTNIYMVYTYLKYYLLVVRVNFLFERQTVLNSLTAGVAYIRVFIFY